MADVVEGPGHDHDARANDKIAKKQGPQHRRRTWRVGLFGRLRHNHWTTFTLRATPLNGQVDDGIIEIDAIDFLDGTPLIDVKPYRPGIDAVPDAVVG